MFPGGKIETSDGADDAAAWCRKVDAAQAARRLGNAAAPAAALGHWVGVIRETFEEVGILLAYAADGRPVRLDRERYAAYRRACQADHRAFWEMLRAERLTLATDTLVYFAHWITPEVQPLRFDTRFFAAPMPEGQEAVADEQEITEVRWLTPREALDTNARGQLSLRNPTVKNLQLFDGAQRFLRRALKALEAGDTAGFASAANRAHAIVAELSNSLDRDAGAAVAADLDRLYDFMLRHLTEGLAQKSAAHLERVAALLVPLRDGFDAAIRG